MAVEPGNRVLSRRRAMGSGIRSGDGEDLGGEIWEG